MAFSQYRFMIKNQTIVLILLLVVFGLFFYSRALKKNNYNESLDLSDKLSHLAIIMDGNRRWAKLRGLDPSLGHQKGAEALECVLNFCLDSHIRHLSLYAFSTENLSRPEKEKQFLFKLIPTYFNKYKQDLYGKDVKVNIVGDNILFPKDIQDCFSEIQEITKDGKRLTVNIMFCYGGRQEILFAVKGLCNKVVAGELSIEDIDDSVIRKSLWLNDSPDPDLIIRTGCRNRVSNFCLWQMAYAEICFLECLWPDFNIGLLTNCCKNFLKVKRTFGS